MRSRLVALAIALLIAAPLAAQPDDPRRGGMPERAERTGAGRDGTGYAQPSAIVSAQIALSSEMRARGAAEALRRSATSDAMLFAPGPVNAYRWLKGHSEPMAAARRQPVAVAMACDGSYAVDWGRWTSPDSGAGHYLMLWRRQPDGAYKWLVARWDPTPAGEAGPPLEDISGIVADCDRRTGGHPALERQPQRTPVPDDPGTIADPPLDSGQGEAPDGSLRWRWQAGATFVVELWKAGQWVAVDSPREMNPSQALGSR